jgi:mannose-6-phosphate isomerase
MPDLYPLRFHSVLRRYLWGGRRLESLGKRLPPGDDYAESWEVVDRPSDQSVVANGALAGSTLHQLVQQYAQPLLGRHAGTSRFPLLMKFLDAQQPLSIQVHPDDQRALRLHPPDFGKTEAWVILEAEPASYLYAGLRADVDRQTLERELAADRCAALLERVEPRRGDCFFLPAGVVHALGPGLLVAEIQQASDTTFRLYDWNRTGPDGRPRPLHLEQALEAIDYGYGPVSAQRPQVTPDPRVEQLVRCDKFVLDRWRLDRETGQLGGDDRCHIITLVDGAIELASLPHGEPLTRGSVILLPAAIGAVEIRPLPSATLLDAYLP